LFSVFSSGIAFASSENWSEVIRFSGASWAGGTESFICDHADWRIRWSYKPIPGNDSILPVRFHFRVYEVGDKLVEFFIPDANARSGTVYFNKTGSFYLYISTVYTENYTIIIGQNLEYIPEFPSWIIPPLFVTTTLVIVIFKKRKKSKSRNYL